MTDTGASLSGEDPRAAFERAFAEERYADALDVLRFLAEPLRSDFFIRSHEAECFARLGRHDEELAIYDTLIAARPDLPSIAIAKANALRLVGRSEEAAAIARAVIARDPCYPTAWWLLSDLKDIRFDAADRDALRAAIGERPPVEADAPLHFALAKAYEDGGDIDGAMRHYRIGNDVRLGADGHHGPGIAPKVDRAIATFDAAFFDSRREWGERDHRPIFVVGQHRAGSTLIEQILDSHPSVEGLGELPLIPQLMRDVARDASLGDGDMMDRIVALDRDAVRNLAAAYRDRTAAYRRTKRPMTVDKLPGNWSNLGFIRLLFPRAVIIDARRHPMGCGLSNYRQNFSVGLRYTRSLTLFGRYYRDYVRFMDHVDRVLPGWVLRVINERLVDDVEPHVRAMLDHAGLDFDPACLAFHTNKRPVRTPSATQVRRPIDRDAAQKWRAYERHLGELRDALGNVLDDWERLHRDTVE